MKPIYFPYTYVTDPFMRVCKNFFPKIGALQMSVNRVPEAMSKWAEQGKLDIQAPDEESSRIFDKILADAENWSQHQRGGLSSFLKAYGDKIPFFDSSSISQIRQDIRKTYHSENKETHLKIEMLRAGLFLQMAQDFDINNTWISQKLHLQESLERNLFKDLKGDEDDDRIFMEIKNTVEVDNRLDFMLMERLKAWLHIVSSRDTDEVDLFLTNHLSVINLIEEYLTESRTIMLAATFPPVDQDEVNRQKRQEELAHYFQQLQSSPVEKLKASGLLERYPRDAGDPECLQLYLLAGVKPENFAQAVMPGLPMAGKDPQTDKERLNTLIGCIQVT